MIITEGLKLMMLGMGTVFIFLTLLYYAILLAGKIISSLGLEKPVQAANTVRGAKKSAGGGDVPVAIISAAIAAFRKGRQKKSETN